MFMRDVLYSEMNFHLRELPLDDLIPDELGEYFAFLNLSPVEFGQRGQVIGGHVEISLIDTDTNGNRMIDYIPIGGNNKETLTICGSMGSALYHPRANKVSTVNFEGAKRTIVGGLVTKRMRDNPLGMPPLDVYR